ncbi:hypothetical protein AVEN_22590-1 [Araneus ventricosus]|uniref:RNase H type-1 domain-containing protein n=1 Tax=Araneus ventricosus TaxID=182803 RepID=A0A4Y2E542_ARAVE|nr:hypothetical protein AVEN_22590-1 [Araneus ventricosus]
MLSVASLLLTTDAEFWPFTTVLKFYHFPGHPFFNYKESQFILRLQRARPSVIPSFFTRAAELLNNLNLEDLQVVPNLKHHLTPWKSHGLNFLNPFKTFDKANTAPEVYQQLFADHRDVYHNFIPIFTDGSKSSLSTSFACVFINSTLSFQIHSSSSIFTAEITAILHALSEISSGPPDNFIIYSDSLSALESITSLNRFSHPLTFNILELHDRLTTKGFTILFCWIPSHVGISGNELADNLARSATNSLSLLSLSTMSKNMLNQSSTQNGKLSGILKTQINFNQSNV